MIRRIGIRPIIFSINCYIASILALFIAFSLDLKTPAWAMVTVYLTSQLAQRIPVRIKLDDVPPDLLFVAGRTATVSIGTIRWW